ncbi:MAG: ABC transporter substrate-binding protein [Pseudomonadota bacterium]
MRKSLNKLVFVGLAVLICSAMVAFTPSAEAAKPEIRHYGTVDLTGPYGILVPDVWEAQLDVYRWVNEEEGGIDGHPVKLIWGETGNIMARAWSHYKRYERAGLQFLWIVSSPEGEAFKNTLMRKNIAAYNYGGSDPQLYPPGTIITDGPGYGDTFGAFLKMAKAEWEKAGKKGTMKVGIIGPDTAYGRAALEPGQRFGKTIGVDVVGQEFVPVVPIDLTPQVLRLRDQGVDWIWMQGLSQICCVFLKNMESLGLHGKIPVGGFSWTTGAEMLRRVGPKFAEGYIYSSYTYMADVDRDLPGVKKASAMRQKYHGKDPDEYYFRGVRAGQFVLEWTKRTLKQYGYKGLTGKNYLATVETFKNWDAPWPVGAIFDVSPNDRRSAKQVRFYQVKGGKIVKYTDWIEVPHLYPPDMEKYFKK